MKGRKEQRERLSTRVSKELSYAVKAQAREEGVSVSEAIRNSLKQSVSPAAKKDEFTMRFNQIEAALKLLANRKGYDDMMGQVELIGELVASSMMAADYHDKEAETDHETALEYMEERYRMFIDFVHARHKEGKLLDDLEKEKRKPL